MVFTFTKSIYFSTKPIGYTYTYTYSTCIECFNNKVKCEFCNKEFNETYSSKHIEKLHLNDNKIINDNDNINLNNEFDNIHEIDTATLALHNMFNRTIIVGPSFCGEIICY